MVLTINNMYEQLKLFLMDSGDDYLENISNDGIEKYNIFQFHDKKYIAIYHNEYNIALIFDDKGPIIFINDVHITHLDPTYDKNIMNSLVKEFDDFYYEQEDSDDLYDLIEEILDRRNNNEDVETLERELAKLYVENPKNVLKKLKEFDVNDYNGFTNYLRKECHNLIYNDGMDFVMVPDEKTKKIWCYSKEEFIENFNPYTLENYKRNFSEIPVSEINLSSDAYKKIKFWIEDTFTLGNVFFKVDKQTAQEFAQTLEKYKTYVLYRGMSFQNEESMNNYLENVNCNPDENNFKKCNSINFNTYSSWTYSEEIAKRFANYFKNGLGIVLYRKFQASELLVDVTKIKNSLNYSNELEVVALPFNGECKIKLFAHI